MTTTRMTASDAERRGEKIAARSVSFRIDGNYTDKETKEAKR